MLQFLLSIFYVTFIFVLIFSAWWYLTIPSNLPPGPVGLPLLGSSLWTWRASTLPHVLLEWSKTYGPLYKFYIAEKLVVVLSNWDAIQEAIVKQGDNFANRPKLNILSEDEFKPGTGLVNSNGDLWKTQRRFALSTLRDFGFGRAILEPKIKDEAEYLCEEFRSKNGRPFDPTTVVANAVSNVISDLVFGRRFDYDDHRFHSQLDLVRTKFTETDVSILTPFIMSKNVEKIMGKIPQIKKYTNMGTKIAIFIRQEIKNAMKEFDPARDEPVSYIQAFYKTKYEGKGDETFNDEQLLTSVFNLFVAGTDTTATTLRWALFYMAQYPEWQDKVYKEILSVVGSPDSLLDYADRTKLPVTEAVIMEVQRMANLAPMGVPRKAVMDTKVCGFVIPKDTTVIPLLTGVLWDEKVYPQPRLFNPQRFLDAKHLGEKAPEISHLIPFLAGKRVCLGESLARMELFILFTAMISKFSFAFSTERPKPSVDSEKMSFIRAPPDYSICAASRLAD